MKKLADISSFERLQSNANDSFLYGAAVFNEGEATFDMNQIKADEKALVGKAKNAMLKLKEDYEHRAIVGYTDMAQCFKTEAPVRAADVIVDSILSKDLLNVLPFHELHNYIELMAQKMAFAAFESVDTSSSSSHFLPTVAPDELGMSVWDFQDAVEVQTYRGLAYRKAHQ